MKCNISSNLTTLTVIVTLDEGLNSPELDLILKKYEA